jgi:hypothetical protein
MTPITRQPPCPASFAAIARPMIPVAPTTTAVRVVGSFGMIHAPPLAASMRMSSPAPPMNRRSPASGRTRQFDPDGALA